MPAYINEGALSWTAHSLLGLMKREWERPLLQEESSSAPLAKQCSQRVLVVILFWTLFEHLMDQFLQTALNRMPRGVGVDLLRRHQSIGSRMDRLYTMLFDAEESRPIWTRSGTAQSTIICRRSRAAGTISFTVTPKRSTTAWCAKPSMVCPTCRRHGSRCITYAAPAIHRRRACMRMNGTENSCVKTRDHPRRRACRCRDTSRRDRSVSKSGCNSLHAAIPRARRSAVRTNRWRPAKKDAGLWPATGKFSRRNRMGSGSRPISGILPIARQRDRIPRVPPSQGWFPTCAREIAA